MSPMATKELQRKYQLEWMRSRREAWLAVHGPCVRCGSDQQLEVDHIDATQKLDHAVWSWSDKRRTEELAKCQVLCRPCHVTKTWTEDYPRQHGTETMYRHGKCRCAQLPCSSRRRRERAARSQGSEARRCRRGERVTTCRRRIGRFSTITPVAGAASLGLLAVRCSTDSPVGFKGK